MTDTSQKAAVASDAFHAYNRAWNVADDAERLDLLRSAVPDDVVWQDPFNDLRGVKALSDFIGDFIRGGQRLITIGGWQQHHAYGRFRWVALNAEGEIFAEGEDVATVSQDAKLDRFMIFAALVDKP